MPTFTRTRLKCECGTKIGIYNKNSVRERGSIFTPLRGRLTRVKHKIFHHEGKLGIIIQIKVKCSKCKQTTTKTIKEVLQ